MTKRTVLVFVPHPDDAEFYIGGTICKMVDEGAQVVLVTATDGGKASFHVSSAELIDQRHKEAKAASDALGVSSLILLGYPDFELDQLAPGKLREQFVRLIRLNKPEVVIAEDVLAMNEIHPDHLAVARAVSEAVSFSHLPLIYPQQIEEGLAAHFVVEKYYFSDNEANLNKIVDITATFERKMAALIKHTSQVEFLVEEIFMQAQLAGVNVAESLGEAANDPKTAIRWAVQSQAERVGKAAGYQFGEAFRFVRFHPYVEQLL